MSTTISAVARKIAAEANRTSHLYATQFDRDGNSLGTYPADMGPYPNPDGLVMTLDGTKGAGRYVKWTHAEIQARLDDYDELTAAGLSGGRLKAAMYDRETMRWLDAETEADKRRNR